MHLLRLFYVSRAAAGLTADDRAAILSASVANNRRDDLTGVLCFREGHFAQILEGEEQAVLRSYLRIAGDRRHRDLVIVHIAVTDRRLFGRWSMGVLGSLEEQTEIFPGEILQLRNRPEGAGDATTVMKRWMRLMEERGEVVAVARVG